MTSVQSVKYNLCPVNFKADNRSRQSDPPMLVKNQKADNFEKEKKKQKRKTNIMTGISIASALAIVSMAIFTIKGMRGSSEDRRLIQEIRNKLSKIKDPAIKQQVEAELAMNAQERNLTRAQNLIKLDSLAQNNGVRSSVDLKAFRNKLDKDIVGVGDAKDSLIEHLKHINYQIEHGTTDGKPIILVFDGSPGTCKTTLAKEAADGLGMYFKKIPCGGISDAQTIIGFKRTYMGSQAGAFAEAQIESGSLRNFYCLDEIDRVTKKEVLDALLAPFDNQAIFVDQYYGAKIDLSQSIFAMTTNDVTKLPKALKDRLNIIHIRDFTRGEKIDIAKLNFEKIMEKEKLAQYIESVDGNIYEKIVDMTNDGGARQTVKLVEELARKLEIEQQDKLISATNKVKIDNKYLDKIKLGKNLIEYERLETERAANSGWQHQNL